MVDDDKKSAEAPFLSRWSQRKQQAREEPAVKPPAVEADAPVPDLPPVDKLTLESDFRAFMHPKVDENLRRSALKKLFSDPHFNVMDGLDTYIDDYSKPDPLPPGMLAGLRQAQNILAWAKETKEETAARFAAALDAPAVSPSGQVELSAADSTPSPALENTTEAAPSEPTPAAEVTPSATNAVERKS